MGENSIGLQLSGLVMCCCRKLIPIYMMNSLGFQIESLAMTTSEVQVTIYIWGMIVWGDKLLIHCLQMEPFPVHKMMMKITFIKIP